MELETRERERDGIVIVDLEGRLTAGEAAEHLRGLVSALEEKQRHRVVLNCAELSYIDSSGLGTLVFCHTTLEKAGGGLRLLDLTERNSELMVITKLSTVLEIYGSEQDAIDSFYPERRRRKKFDILSFVKDQKKGKAQT